ncbi:redoxin domain-containing protein [Halomicrobium zhouii]|uniref:redoxin domain-containing protein n=1 Tax=Halomicrobium zhouii TaxID=767519 RepID=UPI000B7EB566|nr:redoxin domain-containing protein [Halomicrobium zhouii]
MIPAGTDAPEFELPGLVDGEHRRVALGEFLGDDVVILAFYPADFNPACDFDSDLDELDLFTMQKDVEVLAIGPDTLYSHAAFADEYDLHIPLLSDTSHDVAETYGVDFEDDVGQRLVERAVFVVDHDGVIQYAWSTRDMAELPRSEEIKDAIADTGGDDTAFARYRVGHAHYTEGRRAFTSAMGSYRDSEWMVAQSDFRRAREEFEEAADHLDSSARFVDDETFEAYYERSQEKATALWQAADWLSKSASEYSSGRGAEGQRLRDDAEGPLETARDLGEPVDPDDWPPDEDADDEHDSFLPQEAEGDSALAVDIDEAAESEAEGAEAEFAGTDVDGDAEGEESGGEIDDAELQEIEAELTASQPDNPEGEELEEAPTSMVDAPPERTDERVDGSDVGGDDGAEDAGDDEIDDDDLKELEAEMQASQSAAEAANRAAADEDPSDDGERAPLDDDGGGELDGDADGADDGVDPLAESPDDAPADPDADLSSGGSPAPGASRSLEPAGGDGSGPGGGDPLEPDGSDDALDTDGPGDDDDVLDDEPQGASDEDLADIPTAEDLAADEDGEDEDGGDEADEPSDESGGSGY